MEKEKDLTITQAAKLWQVSRQTIYMWIDVKMIKAYKLPSGKWRIPVEEVERIKKNNVG